MAKSEARLALTEYFLEVSLSSRKHIVVEGQTDRRFLESWLHDVGAVTTVSITAVEYLDVDDADVAGYGLAVGNRGRVVVVAAKADTSGVDLRCVADRDCGHDVDAHMYDTLLWTDFPAIESYSLEVPTLDRANLLGFGGRLPGGAELAPALSHALRELYAVRVQHRDLPRPRYDAGLRRKGIEGLKAFDVCAVVAPHLRADAATYPRSASVDPREYAYGHDVGELLYAAFANVFKNQLGLTKIDAVEGVLRGATQVSGAYRNEPLFVALDAWIDA